jgi:hypothetical protein
MRIRAFVAWVDAPGAVPAGAPPGDGWREWRHGSLVVHYQVRDAADTATTIDLPILVLGDDSEWDGAAPDLNMAGGVPIRFDAPTRSLVVHTSIIGLPPVYRLERDGRAALASDIHLLRSVPGCRLSFDPLGVAEFARFGHPVDHRTLFRDVALSAGGERLSLAPDGRLAHQRTWSLPPHAPVARAEFIERQITAFDDAVRRIDTSGTFLSLTAGLDTRTVFSALARSQRLVPSVTMSGGRLSLDARIARRLCRAYGVRHELVRFDERFVAELPRLMKDANLHAGGLSSLGQAPEEYLYGQAGRGFTARLSGNLGNQVGRGGTEGVSVRDADTSILLHGRVEDGGNAPHWLLEKLADDEWTALEFILQREIAFSSVGNFSIGHHHAAQQSPYAHRGLIETLSARPARTGSTHGSASMLRMRMRDLRHRFLGESESVSFQRAFVKRSGGAAATIPINWGWRPAGGVSLGGLALGASTFVGMAARAKGLDDGVLRGPLSWSGLPALHDFRDSRHWLRVDLRDYVMDTLRSDALQSEELFAPARLDAVLQEHFSGRRDHYETVTMALDLALAHENFCTVT